MTILIISKLCAFFKRFIEFRDRINFSYKFILHLNRLSTSFFTYFSLLQNFSLLPIFSLFYQPFLFLSNFSLCYRLFFSFTDYFSLSPTFSLLHWLFLSCTDFFSLLPVFSSLLLTFSLLEQLFLSLINFFLFSSWKKKLQIWIFRLFPEPNPTEKFPANKFRIRFIQNSCLHLLKTRKRVTDVPIIRLQSVLHNSTCRE